MRRQDEFVRRIVEEVNSFDNVILEICDEPTVYGTPKALAGPWIGHLVEVVKQTESGLPKKHLLGQQMMGPIGGPVDFTSHADVSVIVTQYIWQTPDEQVGGMKALDTCTTGTSRSTSMRQAIIRSRRGTKETKPAMSAWKPGSSWSAEARVSTI